MACCKSGLAKLIMDKEPHTIYTHSYGYALNLIAGDVVKGCAIMKDALDVTHEVTKLLKFSPRHDAIFDRLKKELASDSIDLHVLCPTWLTVRPEALSSIYWQIVRY